jgi:DNA-binding MarR family transcriptional regulator
MENQDLRILRILEAVDDNQTITQRDLSKRLNISLGLVNSFVKRLVHKGFFKINTIPRNKVKYMLTPKGAAEKTRLTYEYLQCSLRFYRNSRNKIKALFHDFEKQNVRHIVFFGTGDLAEIAYLSIQETNLILNAVIGDKFIGKDFFGLKINDISILEVIDFDKMIIVEDNFDVNDISRFFDMGIKHDKIQMVIS